MTPLWRRLGAQPGTRDGVAGTTFAVWAPRARAVRVAGDFDGWSGHDLRPRGDGEWEGFVPGAGPGDRYRYDILTAAGDWIAKADPMAQATEPPPGTASVVAESRHVWRDAGWIAARAARDPRRSPMSIYEVHLGSWRPGLGYREVADPLIEHVRAHGFTHVEFLPLAEHPYGGSWGYQVTGYYAPTSRFGAPDDLRELVDRLHGAGIGVVVDWVPGHFARDDWGLARFDGEPLYEHADPRRGEQPEWGTYVFDYANPRVREFLVENACYWIEEFHADGIRVDAVTSMLHLDFARQEGEWVPNEHGGRENLDAIGFLRELTATIARRFPGVATIAEEATGWPGVTRPAADGGLGFGFTWHLGWTHDTRRYFQEPPAGRPERHGQLTCSFPSAVDEHCVLPLSHDEFVHGRGSLLGRMPGDDRGRLAQLRAYLAFMWAHPGKQLLFMGTEWGDPTEWREAEGLDWSAARRPGHREVAAFVAELNRVSRATPALWELDGDPAGLERIGDDPGRAAVAFLRSSASGGALACLAAFGSEPVAWRLPAAGPGGGAWCEVLDSDAAAWGGDRTAPLATIEAGAEAIVPPVSVRWLVAA